MKIEISKDFTFEAAHSLPHLPHFHKCHNLHGHSYKVRVTCGGEIDPVFGWVLDYADISAAMRPILKAVDHTNIDILFAFKREKCADAPRPKPSTAENLAIWFYNQLKPTLPLLLAIEIKETETSLAVYRP